VSLRCESGCWQVTCAAPHLHRSEFGAQGLQQHPHVRRAHVSVKQSTISYLQECEFIVTQLSTGHALLVRNHQASQLLLFPSCNLGLPIIKHYTARSFDRLRLSANDHAHNGRTRKRPLTHPESIDTAQPAARPVVWNNDREW
jgi:hypothetical protein